MPNAPRAESSPANSHQDRPTFLGWWKSPRSTAYAALAIALIAAVVSVAAWLKAHQTSSPSFSGEQSSNAKAKVCSAYALVNKAANTDTPNPRPHDPVSQNAVAANVRLAFLGGGSYLRETLTAEPATPADLAKAVNSMAITLEKMGLSYLAREDASVISPLRQDLGSKSGEINKMCA